MDGRRRFIVGAAVVQVDLPGLGDGRGLVEIHQLVEGCELLGPQEVLTSVVSHHFEVLDVVLVSAGFITVFTSSIDTELKYLKITDRISRQIHPFRIKEKSQF